MKRPFLASEDKNPCYSSIKDHLLINYIKRYTQQISEKRSKAMSQLSRPISAKAKEGIYWFIKRNLTIIKRVQYFVIFLIASAILTFQTYECVEKYLLRNTGTGDKYEHTSKVPFLEMTICPTYPPWAPYYRD